MTDATPYSIPKDPGRWRAFALAMAVHAALVGVLWFSVHWQSETPIAIEAEVWSPVALDAAPLPTPPEPEPEPEAKPEPEPPPPPPKPVVIEKPVVNPDIALALEKKRKEKLQKQLQEQEERARLEKTEKQLAEKKRIEKEKIDALAKKRALEEQKKLAELAKKRAADEQKKLAEDALAKQNKAERSEQARRDKARTEDLNRMMAQAGSGGSGDAPKSQGQRGDAGYLGKVASKIRSNTIFNVPDNIAGNQAVEYAVELLPDGSVRRPIRKVKSSGIPGFDEAVLNAIEKSQPFPADKSGSVPSSINIIHKPKD